MGFQLEAILQQLAAVFAVCCSATIIVFIAHSSMSGVNSKTSEIDDDVTR